MKTRLLKNCSNIVEAEMIKGMLAEEGIECVLGNETMSGYPPMSGVDIFVNEIDYYKASAMIKDKEQAEETKKVEDEQRASMVQALMTYAIYCAVGLPAILLVFDLITGRTRTWQVYVVHGLLFALFMTAFRYFEIRRRLNQNKK